MTITENIKTIDNKIQRNKSQYRLEKQAAKISALPSVNISNYDFLTDKVVLPEKYLLGKLLQ